MDFFRKELLGKRVLRKRTIYFLFYSRRVLLMVSSFRRKITKLISTYDLYKDCIELH